MSYFGIPPCGVILETTELVKFLEKRVVIDAHRPRINRPMRPLQRLTNSQPKMSKSEAAIFLVKFTSKVLLGFFISYFINLKLSEFTVNVVRENQKNKRLFEFINRQIDKVYRNHPDYTPCSARQFKETPIYNYMLAEWRDKTAKENAKLLGYKSINNMITILVGEAVPVPGSFILAVPVKMVLSYCGVRGVISSLYNVALEIDGNTISFGVDFRPDGFLLTNLVLYTFKGEHMIGTYLPDPPDSYYRITKKDIDEVLDRYGDDEDIEILRKEVKRINDKQ